MSEWTFVAVAYGLTWIVLGGYALYVARRDRAAERELERVAAEVER